MANVVLKTTILGEPINSDVVNKNYCSDYLSCFFLWCRKSLPKKAPPPVLLLKSRLLSQLQTMAERKSKTKAAARKRRNDRRRKKKRDTDERSHKKG